MSDIGNDLILATLRDIRREHRELREIVHAGHAALIAKIHKVEKDIATLKIRASIWGSVSGAAAAAAAYLLSKIT